jgi:DNA-binding transcriptional LysR family regulator
MSINFTNLKYFYDSVKLGSVSAAAKANFVTQSAISQGIGKLEKSLGVVLVAHHPNRFRLTPDGEIAFQQAWEILRRTTEFKENLSKDNVGNLEFACTTSFAIAAVPRYLKQFKAAFPHVNVNFNMGKNADIKHMLKTGIIDFGIGPDEGDLEGWEKRNIYKGNFGLYVSSMLKKKEIGKLGFILAESNCKDTIYFREAYRKKHDKEPQLSLEVNSWEMIANLTLEGLGIGYFPDYIALRKKDGLKAYDLSLASFPYRICAFYPKGMKLRKSSEIFLSYFK